MASYCTTQNILDYDVNAKNLTSIPNSPDFTIQIGFISDEIDLRLSLAYPGLSIDDIKDATQLKIICINGVLALLYRSAIIAKGSAAQHISDVYQKTYDSLLKTRIDLKNGETIKPNIGRVYRS